MHRSPALDRALRPTLLVLCGLAASVGAHALGIRSLSPQGEVARVNQVVASFDQDAVRMGDAGAPAPLRVDCDQAAAARGQGRWRSAREWVFQFEADLPPGVRCRVTPEPGFQSPTGAPWTGARSYSFHTGGPFVQQLVPAPTSTIEEDQAFVLRLNGEASADSLNAHLWCAVDGLGERVPVRLVEGAPRAALLKHLGWDKAAQQTPAAATADKPRFGINSLINRMTGGQPAPAQPQGRAMPTMRQQPRAAEYEEESPVEPEQDRIEIPAFLRRQAN